MRGVPVDGCETGYTVAEEGASVNQSRLWGIVTNGQLGDSVEIAGQLHIFRETVLRLAKNRLETVLSVLFEEVCARGSGAVLRDGHH